MMVEMTQHEFFPKVSSIHLDWLHLLAKTISEIFPIFGSKIKPTFPQQNFLPRALVFICTNFSGILLNRTTTGQKSTQSHSRTNETISGIPRGRKEIQLNLNKSA